MAELMSDIVFWVLALVSVGAAALVFVVDSMARATYALALSFVAVGLMLIQGGLVYVGIIVILMMVMEMAVMAVFMVMFMGMNPALMPMSMVHGRRTALVAAAGTFVLLAVGILAAPWPARLSPMPSGGSVTRELGEALMGEKMLVMLTISPVMLATIVAGVVLSLHHTRYDRLGPDLDARPSRDPQAGGVGR